MQRAENDAADEETILRIAMEYVEMPDLKLTVAGRPAYAAVRVLSGEVRVGRGPRTAGRDRAGRRAKTVGRR